MDADRRDANTLELFRLRRRSDIVNQLSLNLSLGCIFNPSLVFPSRWSHTARARLGFAVRSSD